MYQKTLRSSISLSNVDSDKNELHINIKPANPHNGITFIRTDISHCDNVIPGFYTNVSNSENGISLSNSSGVAVRNVEDIMAALWCAKVSNAIIEVAQEEIPCMNGSSEQFIFALRCAGLSTQQQLVAYLNILQPIDIKSDHSSIVEVIPHHNLAIEYTTSALSGTNSEVCHYRFDNAVMNFERTIARAQRCTHISKSTSHQQLANRHLRKPYINEAIRRKIAICIGTLYLGGYRLCGAFHFKDAQYHHYLALIKKIYDTPSCYNITTTEP